MENKLHTNKSRKRYAKKSFKMKIDTNLEIIKFLKNLCDNENNDLQV